MPVYTGMRDFIWLWQLGVGAVSIRYSEITYMETVNSGATKVHLGLGYPIIVEQTQYQILCLIDAQDRLNESLDNSNTA
jgi:hypothetical protein